MVRGLKRKMADSCGVYIMILQEYDAGQIINKLRHFRRRLHCIPEIAFHESKAQAQVLSWLRTMEPDEIYPIAGTGVKAVFYADHALYTAAFRADMDGLPIQEESGVPYASHHNGCMHGCGHDAHMAIALTTAEYVSRHRSELSCNVVFLFQPGEEGAAGAKKMIACGALENPHVNCIYGMHVFPGLPAGKLGVIEGPFLSRSFGFDIHIHGKSAHAAKAYEGVDAIAAAADMITSLKREITRPEEPCTAPVVLHVGSIHGGQRRNVVCDDVTMACTLRTFSNQEHDYTMERFSRIAQDLKAVYGITYGIDVVQDYPVLVNDPLRTREYQQINRDLLTPTDRQMISEDFAYYTEKCPAVFALLGVGNTPPLHSSLFCLDEEPLFAGVEANLRLIYKTNRNEGIV